MVQQVGQHGRVTDIAGRDLDGPHLKRFFVDRYVYFAPYPALGAAMFARIPRAFALRLDACAVQCPAVHHAVMSREGMSRFSVPVLPRYGRFKFSLL